MESDRKIKCMYVSTHLFVISTEMRESASTVLVSGRTWFPLTLKLSYLKTWIPTREKPCGLLPLALLSTSSGLTLHLTAAWASFGKLLQQ